MPDSVTPIAFSPLIPPSSIPPDPQQPAAKPTPKPDVIVASPKPAPDLSSALLLGGVGAGALEGGAAAAGPPGWVVGGVVAAGAAVGAGVHRAQQWQAGEVEYEHLRAQSQHGPLSAADANRLSALAATYNRHPTPMAGNAPPGPSLTTTPVQHRAGSTTTTPVERHGGSTTATPIDHAYGTTLTTPIHRPDHAPHATPITYLPSAADRATFAVNADDVVKSLPGWHVEQRNVTKTEATQARTAFNAKGGPKEQFLKDAGRNHAQELKAAGLSDQEIQRMANQGEAPFRFDVHHIVGLSQGGTNDAKNLLLLQRKPLHLQVTGQQNSAMAGLKYGEQRAVDVLVPPTGAVVSSDAGEHIRQ